MAGVLDEQRISATVNVAISDQLGHSIFGAKSQEITARIFDASPYIVVTGSHDSTSAAGVTSASEGDSGGVPSTVNGIAVNAVPDPHRPNAYVDTTINTTIDCINPNSFSQTNPFSNVDKGNGQIIGVRQGGSMAWSFQMPCTPTYGVPAAPLGTSFYSPPTGRTYQIDVSSNSIQWTKNDQIRSFPR